MRTTRTQTLVLLGVAIGVLTMVVVGATVDFGSGDAGQISGGVPYESPSGMGVTYYGETNVSMESLFPAADTVAVVSEAGNLTVRADGNAHAAIHTSNITGPWTNLTQVSAGGTWVTVEPPDKQRAATRGDVTALSITSMAVGDGTVDFYYAGADGGTVSVRAYGLPADTQLGAFDAATGMLLDGDTTTSGGVGTFDMPASSHNVELRTVDSEAPTLSNPDPPDEATVRSQNQTLGIDVDDADFDIGDDVTVSFYVNGSFIDSKTASSAGSLSTSVGGLSEGEQTWTVEAEDAWGGTTTTTNSFTVDHYDPQITEPSPAGLLDQNPTTIAADIADGDFALDGDELDVNISLDGSQIHSETITSNQTVSAGVPASGQTGGNHTYAITVTDAYGQTTTREVTYSVPDTFYVRNETDHSEILDSNISLEITFYGDDETYTRTTTNGTIKMTGLPVNQDFIAVARPANGGYTTRAAYLTSIYEQQSVYLLNTSAYDTVESRFRLNDPTGQYDSQSVVIVQRAITINGTSRWQTIHADRFGVEGVTAILEDGVRYRVKVDTTDGTQQIVGPYRADVSETVTVRPGPPEVDIPSFENGYGYNAQIDNRTLHYRYEDPENETGALTVWVYQKGNRSNTLVPNSTFYNLGTASNELTVSENESESTWVVNFVIERNGETIVQSRTIANQKQLFDPLAPGLQAAVGVMLLILLAGAFSVLNAGVGAVVVSLTGGLLWWVGLLSGVASGILIAISMFLSVAYYLGTNSGP